MTGPLPNLNALRLVTLFPSGLLTLTPTVPEDDGGVTAVRLVALCTVTEAAEDEANFTTAPFSKPVPVMATVVPPVFGLAPGRTELMAGSAPTARTVNEPLT